VTETKKDGGAAVSKEKVDNFDSATEETWRLNRAFLQIKSADLRRSLVEIAEGLAEKSQA
jgi:hypothetical protein